MDNIKKKLADLARNSDLEGELRSTLAEARTRIVELESGVAVEDLHEHFPSVTLAQDATEAVEAAAGDYNDALEKRNSAEDDLAALEKKYDELEKFAAERAGEDLPPSLADRLWDLVAAEQIRRADVVEILRTYIEDARG